MTSNHASITASAATPTVPAPPAPQYFAFSQQDGIAHLILNRPQALNTMNAQFWRELDDLLQHIHHAGLARVLVLSSTGKHFSAGMALDVFSDGIQMDDQSPEGRAAILDTLAALQATFTRLESLRVPVIAAIHGGCIGGAVDMVTACCLRYATADAFFCIQEINIGMVADVGTLQRLPKLIPEAVAKEMAYTGRRLGSARAMAVGLVNEVFDDHPAMMVAVMQVAAEIAAKPPIAIWGSKQAIHYTRDHSVDDALRQMGWLQAAIWSNRHVTEAVTAMKEKRTGNFPDLAPLSRFGDTAG
jgi:enoyl-CoA hydratase